MKRLSDVTPNSGPQFQAVLPLLEELKAEALRHEAVHHPYLSALADGSLKDPRRALQDFAHEYAGYSAWFPRFLTALEARLPSELRSILDENKAEEGGRYDDYDE